MRQYRPTIEQLKKRYSADMARRKRMEKIAASHPTGYKKVQFPDNSEPWLPPSAAFAGGMHVDFGSNQQPCGGMEKRISTDGLVKELAGQHRVLLLGGMAVIAVRYCKMKCACVSSCHDYGS